MRESLLKDWQSILAVFAERSQLYCTCIASMHPMEILKTSLRRFAASTISQYTKILQTCLVFWLCCGAPPPCHCHNLLISWQECQFSQEEDRPALKRNQSFVVAGSLARTAQITDLANLLSNTLIPFSLPRAPKERKEALPLPLATLVAWEQKLLQPDCPATLGILLGGILLAAHCSLRFKDLQRISFQSLSLSARHLLGDKDDKSRSAFRLPAFRDQHVHIPGSGLASPSRAGVASHKNPLHSGHRARLPTAMPFANRPRPVRRANVIFPGPVSCEMGAANALVANRLRPSHTDRGISLHTAQLEDMLLERLCAAQAARGQPPFARPPQAILRSAVLERRHNRTTLASKTAFNSSTRRLEASETAGTAPHYRTPVRLAWPRHARSIVPR